MKTMMLTMAAAFLAASVAMAGHFGSLGCGCSTQKCCGKTTQVVCEMKKVTKTIWAVECEEFSVLLPGCKSRCGSECGSGCNSGCITPPTCDKIRTRKKLVKKTVTCEVPVYKCIVVPCGETDDAAPEAAPTADQEAKATPELAPAPAPLLRTSYQRPILPRR